MNMKVRRVITHVAHHRISPHSVKISGFRPKLLYAWLRTLLRLDCSPAAFRLTPRTRACRPLRPACARTGYVKDRVL